MMTSLHLNNRQTFWAWARATWLGWVLGVPSIIVLALLGEAVGIGGAQVLVGAGMGAGLGLMQSRALRGVLPRPVLWFWSCALGLALPFLVADLAKVAEWNITYSLYICVALGGLIVGIWQALLLRPRFFNTVWWVVASVAGWAAASGMAAAADSLSRSHSVRGLAGALLYLGIVASGGLVLGFFTGVARAWLLRHKLAT